MFLTFSTILYCIEFSEKIIEFLYVNVIQFERNIFQKNQFIYRFILCNTFIYEI